MLFLKYRELKFFHNISLQYKLMPRREIKKTVIRYQQNPLNTKEEAKKDRDERSRSREKKERENKVQVINQESRRAKLAALKKRKQEQEVQALLPQNQNLNQSFAPKQTKEQIRIEIKADVSEKLQEKSNKQRGIPEKIEKQSNFKKNQQNISVENQSESEEEDKRILLKPVFLTKEDRAKDPHLDAEKVDLQNSKKALRYTTKLLLQENQKKQAQNDEDDDELIGMSSDEETRAILPDDSDEKDEELQYQLWKIRELKRIRRDREERRKAEVQKAEIQRRRKMNNEEILLENKVLGSDANKNMTETKYVYMQKYYHQGAFYRDSEDPIFNRDYNLPTPLEMQDKSMLPEILQKRKGDFGKKGQSKYKHLSAEDTTNFNPQFRADEAILNSYKKKMGGYKGSK